MANSNLVKEEVREVFRGEMSTDLGVFEGLYQVQAPSLWSLFGKKILYPCSHDDPVEIFLSIGHCLGHNTRWPGSFASTFDTLRAE